MANSPQSNGSKNDWDDDDWFNDDPTPATSPSDQRSIDPELWFRGYRSQLAFHAHNVPLELDCHIDDHFGVRLAHDQIRITYHDRGAEFVAHIDSGIGLVNGNVCGESDFDIVCNDLRAIVNHGDSTRVRVIETTQDSSSPRVDPQAIRAVIQSLILALHDHATTTRFIDPIQQIHVDTADYQSELNMSQLDQFKEQFRYKPSHSNLDIPISRTINPKERQETDLMPSDRLDDIDLRRDDPPLTIDPIWTVEDMSDTTNSSTEDTAWITESGQYRYLDTASSAFLEKPIYLPDNDTSGPFIEWPSDASTDPHS